MEPSSTSDPNELRSKAYQLNNEIKVIKKRLKPSPSFDDKYWEAAQDYHMARSRKSSYDLQLKLMEDPNASVEEEEIKIKADEQAAATYGRQAKRLKENPESNSLRSFVDMYLTSSLGANLSLGNKRDPDEQRALREECIKCYNSRINPKKDPLWCPILQEYRARVTCAHIVPSRTPDSTFKEIFDTEEKMKVQNTMILDTVVEELFDRYFIAIVPDVDECSPAAISLWMQSEPRDYRVKVIQSEPAVMKREPYSNSTMTYADLDGRKLQFKSNFRPRSRYLYFHYAICILKLSLNEKKTSEPHQKEIEGDRAFWGTKGRWIKKAKLRGFVEDVGSVYMHYYTDEVPKDEREDDAVLVANRAISGEFKEENNDNDVDTEMDR